VKRDSNTKETKRENEPQELFFMLSEALETGFEWLLVRGNGSQAALKRDEIEVAFEKGKVFLECLTADGIKTWRINSLEKVENSENLENQFSLAATERPNEEAEDLELIRRISAADLLAAIKEARLEIAGRIAEIAASKIDTGKIASVRLSKGIRAGEYGGNAQILLQISPGRQIAVFARVTKKGADAEAFLVSAINWFLHVSQRAKKNKPEKVEKLWLAADKKLLGKLKKIVALLRPGWRDLITLFQVDPENSELRELKVPEFRNLWREKARKIKMPVEQIPTDTAARIAEQAPDAIDITYSAHGENLRFHGLPFARVRTLLGREKAWFRTDKKRRILEPESAGEMLALVAELKDKRSPHATNKDHYFYRASPEHWLENLLCRDITQLDANLILSPIYKQFRASSEQIDLLALRRDGRLVVIELKVSPSREMIFQAANYWRLIELQRRSGNLREARAFGDLEILDEPALVYLVAPALSVHRELEFWAGTITSKIEIYRYDIHENWRENIKVLQQVKIG
jgi:hypothetical protein